MAYEYLNDATDAMFKIIIKETQGAHTPWKAFDVAYAFYMHVLCKGKFVSQRWHFQKKMFEWNPALTAGIFKNNLRQLSPGIIDEVKEIIKAKS